MPLPPLTPAGDLPPGIHLATVTEVAQRFGVGNKAREIVMNRLVRIWTTAKSTGHLARLIVFGSFVTDKSEPNDVDVILLMDDDFIDSNQPTAVQLLFKHLDAEREFGATVFWTHRDACLGDEDGFLQLWQVTRTQTQQGIVEITGD
jgi:hypothetical protein